MKKDAITYNYWIFILTCLVLMGIAIKLTGRDPGTQWDFVDIAFRLLIMFFFATLAWFIGKKYLLHYSLVCGLCILILSATNFLKEIGAMIFHQYFSIEIIGLSIFLGLFGSLIFGGVIFIMSFPFQFLFHKYKQNSIKLK